MKNDFPPYIENVSDGVRIAPVFTEDGSVTCRGAFSDYDIYYFPVTYVLGEFPKDLLFDLGMVFRLMDVLMSLNGEFCIMLTPDILDASRIFLKNQPRNDKERSAVAMHLMQSSFLRMFRMERETGFLTKKFKSEEVALLVRGKAHVEWWVDQQKDNPESSFCQVFYPNCSRVLGVKNTSDTKYVTYSGQNPINMLIFCVLSEHESLLNREISWDQAQSLFGFTLDYLDELAKLGVLTADEIAKKKVPLGVLEIIFCLKNIKERTDEAFGQLSQAEGLCDDSGFIGLLRLFSRKGIPALYGQGFFLSQQLGKDPTGDMSKN